MSQPCHKHMVSIFFSLIRATLLNSCIQFCLTSAGKLSASSVSTVTVAGQFRERVSKTTECLEDLWKSKTYRYYINAQ